MKKTNNKVDVQDVDSSENEVQKQVIVSIDDASLDKLAEKVAGKMMPMMFVCARVASRDTIRTPMRDLRAIFKDVVEEAKVAHGFFTDSMS